jgi:hypothetical protein
MEKTFNHIGHNLTNTNFLKKSNKIFKNRPIQNIGVEPVLLAEY